MTTAFYNRTHTRKFSGITTAFWEHTRCVNGTGLDNCHVIQRERELLCCTNTRQQCVACCHVVVSVTYSDGEMSCVSSFRSNLHRSCSCQFCVLRVTQMLHSPPKYYCCRLMKIWWMNSWLDWTLVLSESDKTFSFINVVIFDITLVTVSMVTGKEYGLDSRYTFIQTVFETLLCERGISRLTPVSKCGC